MSITVRLFTDQELRSIENGEDPWLATLLLNKKTFLKEELMVCYRLDRKKYNVVFEDPDNPVTILAVSDQMLLKFLKKEFRDISKITSIDEVVTDYRIVYYKDVFGDLGDQDD